MNLKQFYKDWYCGFKSGIPICCVIFFNIFWGRLPRAEPRLKELKVYQFYRDLIPKSTEYTPCPFCLILNRKKEIKSCDWFRCHNQEKIKCNL